MARSHPEGAGLLRVTFGGMEDTPAPGLVERVDHLTAAVADLSFKLETLISSTTAFRESFGERMTDYADLVAHWSIETEENLSKQRSVSERLVSDLHRAVDAIAVNLTAAIDKVEHKVLEAIEANVVELPPPPPPPPPAEPVDLGPVLSAVEALREGLPILPDLPEPIDHSDAIAAVLAEVTSVRDHVPTVDLAPLAEEVRGLRRDLARLPDMSPVADEVRQLREALLAEASVADEDDTSLAEAVGQELTALRAEMKALQKKVAERPPVPPEVEALTAELQALRREMEAEPAASVESEAAPSDDLHDTLTELVYEVRSLRRRFPVKPPPGEPDPDADAPPPVPPKRGAGRR